MILKLGRFSTLAESKSTALCSPRAQFTCGPAEQQTFGALKAALTSAPVLRVRDPPRLTRRLTDASELAVSAILEQRDDAGAFHPVAFESRKPTQPERSHPPHLLELLAAVSELKTLHVSHHQARWLNLLAEYQHHVVHIRGRTNPADFFTRKRFPDGQGPAQHKGHDEPAFAFVAAGPSAEPPRFLNADFVAADSCCAPVGPGPGAPLRRQRRRRGEQAGGCPLHPQNIMYCRA